MSDAEWAVTEPALPARAWKQGRGDGVKLMSSESDWRSPTRPRYLS